VFGSKGSNACPEGSTRIVDWAVCAIAADDSGKYFYGKYSWDYYYPAGCIVMYDNVVYFNMGSPGAAEANTQPLCIPGAPPRFCAAIVSHPADTLGVLERYYASNHLTQTLLQSAQSRSDECAACMQRARLLPTCAILVCGAKQFSLCVTMGAACVHV
jgi:hypothetical protein